VATSLRLPEPELEPPAAEPFHLSEGWARCWAAAYGSGRPVEDGALRMELREGRLGPLRFPLLASATNLQTCYFDSAGALPEDLPERLLATGAEQAMIEWLAEDSGLLAAARRWEGLVTVDPFAISPLADCRGGFESYLARTGSTMRKYWKACRRQVIEGPLDFSIVRGGPGLGALLGEMFALEAQGWKGRDGSAILCSAADSAFYTALAHEAAAAGALRIALLREEGRLVAYEYCILGGESVLALKVAYDESRARLQPGHLLALMNIRDACADPALGWYDMLGNGMGVADYKRRFATDYRTLYRVRLFAPTAVGRLLHALYRARPFAKAVRERARALGRRSARTKVAPRLKKAGSGSLHAKT
jgi:CelD/BcsL family acetyltransferase involved in cellulose biosynthesis